MGELADKVIGTLVERVELGADTIGVEMVEWVRNALSVPVETLPDGTVLRSLRGEYPRKEFGNLWASERHEVQRADAGVTLDVVNDAAYARRLEFDLDRPFHRMTSEYWFPLLPGRIGSELSGK